MLASRRHVTDSEKLNLGRYKKSFRGENYGYCCKRCSTFGDHRREIKVFGSKLTLKNAYRGLLECSHPDGMPQTLKKKNLGRYKRTFRGKVYDHRSKYCSTFGDHRCQIDVFWSELILKNGFWAPNECSHPDGMPWIRNNLNLGRYKRTFWGETTAIAPKVAQILVITVAKLGFCE